MARISTVRPEEFRSDLAELLGRPTDEQRVAVGSMVGWARRPDVAITFIEFQRSLDAATTLSPRLLELVRLRVAFHNQCRSCMAVRSSRAVDDGVDSNAVCSLQRPYEAPDLSDDEKVALKYADLMANDHLSADDATFDDLRAHFTENEIVELGIHVGICVGFGRLAATWDLVEDLPDELRTDADVAPWLVEGVQR